MSDQESTIQQPHEPRDRSTSPYLTRRRDVLRSVGATGALTAVLASGVGESAAQPSDDPFTLGVTSGDPLPDSVVLWTRLAPEPLAGDGGMPDEQVQVTWEVATDEGMSDVVQDGTANAGPDLAHSIHVDVTGLQPETEYYYRFSTDSATSPVGHTKTAPAAAATVEEIKFAFVSCQHYIRGYYTAHEHLAQEDLDVAFHLGDYIYENGLQGDLGRGHEPPRETVSLADYRIRHAQYKTDSNLQAAHAAFPWIVTWDDHEVDNNWADENSQDDDPPDEFLERRADAFQAYYEHMPIRPSRAPTGPDMSLYRRFTFGDLAAFNVLDTRQYRDDQVHSSEAASDPDRTILGDEQESWLLDGLTNSSTTWNVLANQTPFAARDSNPNPGITDFGGGDKWDGYRADRETLLDAMAENSELNPVVITGDVHRNYAYDLKADFSDPDSATIGTEFVGTSMASTGDGTGLTKYGRSLGEPWQRFFNDDRGYVRCTITPDRCRTDYRIVSTVREPSAPVRTHASFATDAGASGVQLISEKPEHESITITEIEPIQNGDLNSEFVKLRNTGDSAIDCSGFLLSFEGGRAQNYIFGGFTLAGGETVTVRNGSGTDTQSTLYTGWDSGALNNTNPDTVIIANGERTILHEATYGFRDGARIQSTVDLNTRHRPGTDSRVVATMPPGSEGEIVNGPVDKDGYTWWGIHWLADDIWGWSVQEYLKLA